jgi:quinol-cytochrome oxidoreductase complex cytochrome b subunit
MTWTHTFWRLIGVAVLIQMTVLTALAYIGPDKIEGQWNSRLGAIFYAATSDIGVIQFAVLLVPAAICLSIGLFGRSSP